MKYLASEAKIKRQKDIKNAISNIEAINLNIKSKPIYCIAFS